MSLLFYLLETSKWSQFFGILEATSTPPRFLLVFTRTLCCKLASPRCHQGPCSLCGMFPCLFGSSSSLFRALPSAAHPSLLTLCHQRGFHVRHTRPSQLAFLAGPWRGPIHSEICRSWWTVSLRVGTQARSLSEGLKEVSELLCHSYSPEFLEVPLSRCLVLFFEDNYLSARESITLPAFQEHLGSMAKNQERTQKPWLRLIWKYMAFLTAQPSGSFQMPSLFPDKARLL